MMKDYQVLISGVLIAVAIFFGLTYEAPDPFAGASKVPEPIEENSFQSCVRYAEESRKDGNKAFHRGEILVICGNIPN